MNWFPIDSAPKDGSLVLLFVPDEEPQFIAGGFMSGPNGRGWTCPVVDGVFYAKPTHWVPLPAPPEVA